MNVPALLLGPLGAVFSSSCVLIVLFIMLYMSWRLFRSRRRKAYLSLTLSLILITIHYLLLVGLPEPSAWAGGEFDFAARVLKTLSFILINMAFYQLYNSTHRRHFLYLWSLVFGVGILTIIHWRIPLVLQGTAEQVALLQDIGLELFLFLLMLLSFFYVAPRTGPSTKFRFAVAFALAEQLAYLLNRFVFTGEPVDGLVLVERFSPILYYMLLFQMLFERTVELMQAIYRSSITDGLTGLYNRRFFLKRTEQYVARELPVSVIFGDIDNFKRLNDTQGHQRGDEVLRQVAAIAMEVAEDVGIAGRYGGEEMVILVVDSAVNVARLAEYFRERVEQESGATISLGFSKWKSGLSAQELIRQADEAMYQAKTTGKNKVVAFSGSKSGAVGSKLAAK